MQWDCIDLLESSDSWLWISWIRLSERTNAWRWSCWPGRWRTGVTSPVCKWPSPQDSGPLWLTTALRCSSQTCGWAGSTWARTPGSRCLNWDDCLKRVTYFTILFFYIIANMNHFFILVLVFFISFHLFLPLQSCRMGNYLLNLVAFKGLVFGVLLNYKHHYFYELLYRLV